jgi:hypothetical protein
VARRNPEVTIATIAGLAVAAWVSYHLFFKKPRVLAPDEYVRRSPLPGGPDGCYEIATGKPVDVIHCEEQERFRL